MQTNRVTIIAIGVGNYDYLSKLPGPSKDLEKFKKLLVSDESTAIFSDDQFKQYIDITTDQFRNILTEYAITRSAQNDILILYFSGHGAPVGNNDFGLCFKDTRSHPDYNTALSLNIVKFRDIIETISLVKVDPLIIIDSCFSGQAIEYAMQNTLEQMKYHIQAETGSNYALLSSCSKLEETPDSDEGGLFSNIFFNIASNGLDIDHNKRYITLPELYPYINKEVERACLGIKPKLYIGDTFVEFGFIKNAKYKPIVYSFSSSFKKIMTIFWNDGNPKEYTTEELRLKGSTAQTTYTKLSYSPGWGLIEKLSRGKGRLTKKGIDFINGRIAIPYEIRKTEEPNKYIGLEGTKQIYYNDFK